VYHLEFRCPTCGSKWREFRKFNDHRDVENQVSACKECWRTELISPISYEEVE
jgi:hypothetical protein